MIPDSKPSARYLRISEEQLQAFYKTRNWHRGMSAAYEDTQATRDFHERMADDIDNAISAILATAKRVEVDDAMVERACEAYEGPYHFDFQIDQVKENSRISMRAALQAARGLSW